ncbi:MAG TPA: nuclear transport factor 2 family protein [Pyrinomonadaceae bacterium]|jgi:ketosteroid isomerase-like protein|nr:nuclear transport factor 2 family protein [Pyrinomonadaceae bacterium]
MAAPRFDEKSVQRAQPAVPLGRRPRLNSWMLTVGALCVLAGLGGGVVGAYVLSLYQRGTARYEAAEATRAPAPVPAPSAANETAAPAQTTAATQAPPAAAPTAEAAPRPAAEQVAAVIDKTPPAETTAPKGVSETAVAEGGEPAYGKTKEELRGALDGWVAATNARDVGRQMQFYGQTLGAFYLSRNASREAVRAEKARLFAAAPAVDIRAGEPEIRIDRDGKTAVMRFRKRYQIGGAPGSAARSGEVLQELRWRRTPGGWKIVAERDVRVLQ